MDHAGVAAVNRALSLWAPVAIYMAAIVWASSLSVLPGSVEGFPDWLLHSACYAGLAVVSLRAASGGQWKGVTLATIAAAWLICAAYGASDESPQGFVPGRMVEFRDWRNDVTGAALALGAVWAWGKMRRVL
jgi:VanZ family protein